MPAQAPLIATQPISLHALHALQAASLGGDGLTMEPACQLALDANFGHVQAWREAFAACAMAHSGSAGWVLLVFQPQLGTLVNEWVAEQAQVQATGVPILALHAPAHAAGGPAAAAHVDAQLAQIAWAPVYARYQAAVHAASDGFSAPQQAVHGALLLDVRRAGVYQQADQTIPGARWCDPALVALWAATLPADREVLVYCVYGHEVGRATALRLRAAGLRARFLHGGIDGWTTAGLPLAAKAAG